MKRPNSTGAWEGRQSLSKLDLSRYCDHRDLCSNEVGYENLAFRARPQREQFSKYQHRPHISSSLPVLHSLLSQCLITTRVRIHGRRHCGDHEAWVWSQSCDDTSETRPRQVLYSTVPIVISARDTLPTSQETLQLYPSPCLNPQNLRTQSRRLPRPFCPRPFPSPSRACTSKPRKQEIVPNAAISTVKKGVVDHSLLSREDESHANPGDPPSGERAQAATPRHALLAPIKPGIGDGQVLPRTPCPNVMMRAVDQDTVQVCPPQCPFCAYSNTV